MGACVIVTYRLITWDMLINQDHSWLRWNCTSDLSQAFSVIFWSDFLPSHRHTDFTLLWNCVTIIYIQYCEPSELSALVWVYSLHEYDIGKAIAIVLWNIVLSENPRIIHSLPMSLAPTYNFNWMHIFSEYFVGHIVYSYTTNSQHLYSVLQISKKLKETVEPE